MLALLLPLITALAPMAAHVIGNALGGKSGQAIAATVEPAITAAVLQSTGMDNVEAAKKVLLANPSSEEAKAFIARMNELSTQVQMAKMQADLANVQSARSMLVELAHLGSVNAYFMPILTLIVVFGVFLSCWWLLTTGTFFDDRKTAIVNVVFGALLYSLKDVLGFWTGTTSGSRMKDAQIAAIPQSPAQAAPPMPVSAPPAAPAPSVVVVPQMAAPAAQPAPEAERMGLLEQPAEPEVSPGTPGTAGGWRRIRPGAAGWRVTEDGVLFEGEERPSRTIGEPVTVTRIWRDYGPMIARSSVANGVPYLLAVACIATESGGRATALLTEPDGRQSVGLMQTLLSTAEAMAGRKVTAAELNDPAFSVELGVRYIADRRRVTGFDPVLVAAAHNAGGVYYVEEAERKRWPNEFRIRSTSDHIRRFVAYFDDGIFVEKRDGWAAQAVEWTQKA